MRELLRYRAMAAECRKKMVLFPKERRRWEIEAIQWDTRALDFIAAHFKCSNFSEPESPSTSTLIVERGSGAP
jgi:hypothetical protein